MSIVIRQKCQSYNSDKMLILQTVHCWFMGSIDSLQMITFHWSEMSAELPNSSKSYGLQTILVKSLLLSDLTNNSPNFD